MPFRFALDETPQTGLRRIAVEQAAKIVTRLSADAGDETTVHESRKALKRLKALFKLVRGGLSKQTYAKEYGIVRDVARSLSGVRDFEVMPATLAGLIAAGANIDRATAEQVRNAIAEARVHHAAPEHRTETLASATRQFTLAGKRYARLKLHDDTFEALAGGAARGLRTLRRQHGIAVASGKDDDYHDWRKSAQLHWRHLRLLTETWPAFITARVAAAKGLADTLGHDHDLSVLARFIEAPTIEGSTVPRLKAARRKSIQAAIRARQQALREEARAYADLLVLDEPRDLSDRLKAMHAARLRIARLEAPLCDLFTKNA